MTRHRRIISIVVFVAALSTLVPALATANSLLSGYGGPGQGSQAIVGAGLVNGPTGGGGSPGAGGSSTAGASSAAATSSGAPAASTLARGHSHATSGRRADGRTTKQAQGGSSNGFLAYPVSSTGEGPGAGGSSTVGLSGTDMLYVLLALGVLAFTGVFTRRLAHGRIRREGPRS